MDEYISKHDAYTTLKDLEAAYIYPPVKEAYATAARRIDQIKPTDVQPVKHGRWIHFNDDGFIFCTECKHEAYWDTDYGQQLFDYCPYCGARMIKDGDTDA